MDINNLMKEAQKMQQRMQDAQQALAKLTVTGEAGGGLVKVTMNGRHEVSELKINPSLLDDQEMLSDVVIAAFNAAVQKVEKESQGMIQKLTAGMNLPKDLSGKGDSE